MSAVPSRIATAVARMGDVFEIDAAESVGVFAVLGVDEAGAYLTEAELAAAPRPLWLVQLAHDDPAEVDDEMEWNGLTLTVLKTVDVRVAHETVSRIAIAA